MVMWMSNRLMLQITQKTRLIRILIEYYGSIGMNDQKQIQFEKDPKMKARMANNVMDGNERIDLKTVGYSSDLNYIICYFSLFIF